MLNRFRTPFIRAFQRPQLVNTNYIQRLSKVTATTKEVVVSEFCKPKAAYSAAIKCNGTIYVSGQLGLANEKFVGDDAPAQAKQVL